MAEIKGKITNPALVNAKVFTTDEQSWGYLQRSFDPDVPECFCCCAVCYVFQHIFRYFADFICSGIGCSYEVRFHGDPDAHKAWIYGYLSPSRLNNTHAVKRRITFIDAI
ncbi:hypothetical protein SE959_27490 [Escherichia coli]|nr:hypothetical protein [Escherichia coli]MDW9200392.1 hypothetical protein [Escherichia coli]